MNKGEIKRAKTSSKNISPFISMSGISKTYDGNKFVLNDLSFSLCLGEIAIIMGPSGSGKSTFLNILGLLDKASSGKYLFNGNDLCEKRNKKLYSFIRGEKIGFVFQSYYLIETLTVRDNIMMPFLYSDTKITDEIEDHISEYAQLFGVTELLDKKASLLSGGERQRVAIIRAMIKKPCLVIADEPTGNLDEKNGETVINAFRKIAGAGTAVVIVTHNSGINCPEGKRFQLCEGKLHEIK
ncbi:MAG: ABC transporter ATP-binding protein [Lachnospiraceae bacterium]|nr:ABC transporter ATP-binding protein [Lachnospiraceae bacterium]